MYVLLSSRRVVVNIPASCLWGLRFEFLIITTASHIRTEIHPAFETPRELYISKVLWAQYSLYVDDKARPLVNEIC
jgi:hypothetical protein